MRAVPLQAARNLARQNRATHEALEHDERELSAACTESEADLGQAFAAGFNQFLAPFADIFAKIKNVELDDLPTVRAVPELTRIDVRLHAVSVQALRGLLSVAGGATAGAAAGGAAFTTVGLLATASTGTAISTLSGAAATSATLAWLGGGSLAAGGAGVAGGTMILGAVVAFPVLITGVGFLYLSDRKNLRKQLEVAEQLKQVAAGFEVGRTRAEGAIEASSAAARVVRRLVELSAHRLAELADLIEGDNDFATYSASQKGLVIELAGVATAVAAVIACPIVDEHGNVRDQAVTTERAGIALAYRLAS